MSNLKSFGNFAAAFMVLMTLIDGNGNITDRPYDTMAECEEHGEQLHEQGAQSFACRSVSEFVHAVDGEEPAVEKKGGRRKLSKREAPAERPSRENRRERRRERRTANFD